MEPTKIAEDLTDEQCLNLVIALLEDRVSVNSGLMREEETGNITHQVLQIQCGDYTTYSQPEALTTPLRTVTADEAGETVQ